MNNNLKLAIVSLLLIICSILFLGSSIFLGYKLLDFGIDEYENAVLGADYISPEHSKIIDNKTFYLVEEVVDGDTIKVWIDNELKTVRLVGIDTPESVHPTKPVECFAIEASNKLDELLTQNYISLEIDPTQGDTDRYGRLLRIVYLEDNTDINALMIKEGYAFSYKDYPHVKIEEYNKLEQEARDGQLGLWGDTCSS